MAGVEGFSELIFWEGFCTADAWEGWGLGFGGRGLCDVGDVGWVDFGLCLVI